jgi:hypothetical protein
MLSWAQRAKSAHVERALIGFMQESDAQSVASGYPLGSFGILFTRRQQ